MIYGYARISKKTQKIERQIENIYKAFPDAAIYQEAYTGTTLDGRKRFAELLKKVKAGDTIVFDSVSRMSRNAEEGIALYFKLHEKGIKLIFLKEPYINTENYERNQDDKIKLTGADEDILFDAINNYLRKIAQKQIKIAFDQAEKEVTDLHERTKEGIREARRRGKQIGQKEGATLNVKKKAPAKAEILKKSKDFNGHMTDKDLMKVLGLSRNTYYKYKKEVKEEASQN